MAMNAAIRLPQASLPLGALQRRPSMLYGDVAAQGSRAAPYSGTPDSRARARAGRHHVSRQVQMSAGAQAAFYDFNVKDIDGEELSLSKYKGKAVLVVNVASRCGFTAQYAGLSDLYNRYQSKGLEILAFPCNQFGGQEPGSNEQIKDFAQSRGAEFQMMSKVDVNGPNEAPLYSWLKSKKNGGMFEMFQSNISWNFNKFLLDRNGEIVGRYGPMTTPEQLESDIQKCLA